MRKKRIFSLLLAICTLSAFVFAVRADVDWGGLLKEKTAMVNETDFELYVEGSIDSAPFYGARLEPRAGSYIGSTADTKEEYKQLGSFLSYIERFDQGDFYEPGRSLIRDHDVITLVGWTVDSLDNVDYDGIRRTLAKINSYGKPMLVRFANEMNVSALGNDAAKYVEVFRTVADMIHEYDNLAVVWSPNDLGSLDRPFDLYWPGNDYVDWIGVSCYMNQYFQGNANTEENDTIYFMTGAYAWATNHLKPIIKFMEEKGIQKPVMISEGGVATSAGEEWAAPRLRNMLYNVIMKYPQVKMINYFNVYRADEAEKYNVSNHPYAEDILNEAANCGGYVRQPYGLPRFAFNKADNGDTLVADANGIINLYTLAYIPKTPNITVNYKLDGEWKHSSPDAPYVYHFDISGVSDGEHTITIEGSGQSKTYKFIKRDTCIRFGGGEPDPSQVINTGSVGQTQGSGSEPQNPAVSADDVSVYVLKPNGEVSQISFTDQQPVVVDPGYTLLPLRNIFEGMGIPVDWNGDTKTVKWGNCIMKIDADTFNKLSEVDYGKNNRHHTTVAEDIPLEVPAQIMNGRTMVPVRAVAESSNYEVQWYGDTRTIVISMMNAVAPDQVYDRLSDQGALSSASSGAVTNQAATNQAATNEAATHDSASSGAASSGPASYGGLMSDAFTSGPVSFGGGISYDAASHTVTVPDGVGTPYEANGIEFKVIDDDIILDPRGRIYERTDGAAPYEVNGDRIMVVDDRVVGVIGPDGAAYILSE